MKITNGETEKAKKIATKYYLKIENNCFSVDNCDYTDNHYIHVQMKRKRINRMIQFYSNESVF